MRQHTPPATEAQTADDQAITLGPNPETDDPVPLSPDTLRTGCYIEGDAPQLQTTLCHSLLSQVAAMGDGFCYVHPTDEVSLALVRALPEHRLEDVVWIHASPEASTIPLPDAVTHVTVDPLDVDTDATCLTPPASGRTVDLLDTLAEDDECDWNVARLLARLADQTARHDRSFADLHAALAPAPATDSGDSTPLAPWLADALDTSLPRASTIDDTVSRRVHTLLTRVRHDDTMTALDGPTSCSIQDLITDDAIILVAGDLPRGEPTTYQEHCRQLASRLILSTVIRRVWEGLQTAPADTRCIPLVIDECARLFAHEPHLFEELVTQGTTPDTPLGLVCCGDSFARFEFATQFKISRHLATRILVAEQLPTELLSPDLPASNALAQVASDIGQTDSMDPTSWIGQVGDHPTEHETFTPFETPVDLEYRIDTSRATYAITESLARHGRSE